MITFNIFQKNYRRNLQIKPDSMKKLILTAFVALTAGFALSTTSCNDRICVECTKIDDETEKEKMCTNDQYKRNDFIVEWTHLDYNCQNVAE